MMQEDCIQLSHMFRLQDYVPIKDTWWHDSDPYGFHHNDAYDRIKFFESSELFTFTENDASTHVVTCINVLAHGLSRDHASDLKQQLLNNTLPRTLLKCENMADANSINRLKAGECIGFKGYFSVVDHIVKHFIDRIRTKRHWQNKHLLINMDSCYAGCCIEQLDAHIHANPLPSNCTVTIATSTNDTAAYGGYFTALLNELQSIVEADLINCTK